MRGEQRQQVGVRVVRRGHDGPQQHVVPGQVEHAPDRAADRLREVARVLVEGPLHHGEEPAQLVVDHGLGQRLLGPDLVVDRLPAHADRHGQPGHGDRRPALPRRLLDRGGDDPRPVRAAGALRGRGWLRHGAILGGCLPRRLPCGHDEVGLVPHAAVRAAPRVRHGGPRRARGEALARVADPLVVDAGRPPSGAGPSRAPGTSPARPPGGAARRSPGSCPRRSAPAPWGP